MTDLSGCPNSGVNNQLTCPECGETLKDVHISPVLLSVSVALQKKWSFVSQD